MPISVTTTAGGTGYVDIRVGGSHNIHQALIDVSNIAADIDDDGYIPPGLPLQAAGTLVSGADQVVAFVVGPEAVQAGAADHMANVFLDGALNRDAIEDNIGRALSANEVAALAAGGFKLV